MNTMPTTLENETVRPSVEAKACDANHDVPAGELVVNHETGETVCAPGLREFLCLAGDGKLSWADILKKLFVQVPLPVFARITHSIEPDGRGCFCIENRLSWPDGTVHWFHAELRTSFITENGLPRPLRTVGSVRENTALILSQDTPGRNARRTDTCFAIVDDEAHDSPATSNGAEGASLESATRSAGVRRRSLMTHVCCE
jgi:hypothetical protein